MRGIGALVLALALIFGPPASRAETPFDALGYDRDAAYIDLGDVPVSDWTAFYAYLDGFERLERVDMFATRVYRKQVDELARRYPQIVFGWTLCFGEHTVRTDATAFSTLHVSGSATHTSSDFSLLRYCTKLRALDIGHNTAGDLSFLEPLTELRVLILACNRVKDLTPLAGLRHLEYLELFSNGVEDLSPLKELPYLAHLNIGYNNIRDLSPLYEMPQLKRLWMKKCHGRGKTKPLDEETIASLRAALPGCEINDASNPTAGGWRDEAHFEVFHAYFRSGEYRAFDDSPEENR